MSSDVEQKINEQQDVGGSVPNEIVGSVALDQHFFSGYTLVG